MKYFLHDSNAFQDEKITELFINFGYEGIGLFFTILEKIAMQEKPVKTDVLKKQLFVGKRLYKCWSFMEEIGLISSNNGETFNKQLLNFSEKYQIKKEKNAKRISEWRKNQQDIENVTRYEQVCNTPKVNRSKVNRSKVKEIKEIDIPEFEEFKIYAKEKKQNIDLEHLKLKYESWKISGWKDGNGNKIKNWKSKLLNTLPYIKENINTNKAPERQKSIYDFNPEIINNPDRLKFK